MMHQSEFDAANVALSRAADKRKSLINIHNNWHTATLRPTYTRQLLSCETTSCTTKVTTTGRMKLEIFLFNATCNCAMFQHTDQLLLYNRSCLA